MPMIDLTDDEHVAVTRAVRRTIDDDRYPLAPRLAPLRSALAKLDPASVPKPIAPRPPLPTGPSVGNRRGKVRRWLPRPFFNQKVLLHSCKAVSFRGSSDALPDARMDEPAFGPQPPPSWCGDTFWPVQRTGHWLEREADDEWRNAARQFLQSGRWFSGAVSILLASRILFTRIYGERYFSLLALGRCASVTILLAAVISLLQALYWKSFDHRLLGVYLWVLMIAIPSDYLTRHAR
jgi:hypothetical protein